MYLHLYRTILLNINVIYAKNYRDNLTDTIHYCNLESIQINNVPKSKQNKISYVVLINLIFNNVDDKTLKMIFYYSNLFLYSIFTLFVEVKSNVCTSYICFIIKILVCLCSIYKPVWIRTWVMVTFGNKKYHICSWPLQSATNRRLEIPLYILVFGGPSCKPKRKILAISNEINCFGCSLLLPQALRVKPKSKWRYSIPPARISPPYRSIIRQVRKTNDYIRICHPTTLTAPSYGISNIFQLYSSNPRIFGPNQSCILCFFSLIFTYTLYKYRRITLCVYPRILQEFCSYCQFKRQKSITQNYIHGF